MSYILELQGDKSKIWTYLYCWFHTDGYFYDIVSAAVLLIINSYVALFTVQPVNRRAFLYSINPVRFKKPSIRLQICCSQ